MAADLLMIRPVTGDSSAPIFASGSTNSDPIGTLESGTILKMTGKSNGYYQVAYENDSPDGAKGGTASTGTIVAVPYTYLYKDKDRLNILGKLNNGTTVTIIDDSNYAIFKISGLTTEGTYEGYIQSKFIFRHGEIPEPLQASPMTRTMSRSVPYGTVGYVYNTGTSGLNVRQTASTSADIITNLPDGTAIEIISASDTWFQIKTDYGEGYSHVWVYSSYIRLDGADTNVEVSDTDATPVTSDTDTSTNSSQSIASENSQEDYTVYFDNISSGINYVANDEYYKQLADKYSFALGSPPKYNVDIDPQYSTHLTSGYGRAYSKTILSSPSLLSICPGTVEMFPNAIGERKDGITEAMIAFAGGNQSLLDKIASDEGGIFSGKMYSFKAATAEYSPYLNALCRASAILCGIGDRLMPHTQTKLKDFDYSYWTIRKLYNPAAASSSDTDSSMFKNFWSGLVYSAQSLPEVATDDSTYMNFFLNSSETTVNENIQTDVTAGPLSDLIEGVSNVGAQINYFTGSGFSSTVDEAEKAISAILGGGGDVVSGILNMGENFLKGGRMVMPKMLSGASYGKTISCSMKYFSPYGDIYSIFLRCIVPVCHLLAMALPRQLSDNMYTFPFVVRCAQIGAGNVDLGVITGITVNRGGQDDTSWTIDSVATEWDVSVEITPLIDDLMVTSSKNPILFCKNENLLDYLGNFCGFDLLASNLGTKAELVATFLGAAVRDIPDNLGNTLSDTAYNTINRYFRFSL